MPKKHHSEEQIVSALKPYVGGEKTTDICRKLGVSQATFYIWKKQYAGPTVQELHELRSLREENGRISSSDWYRNPGAHHLQRVSNAKLLQFQLIQLWVLPQLRHV